MTEKPVIEINFDYEKMLNDIIYIISQDMEILQRKGELTKIVRILEENEQ